MNMAEKSDGASAGRDSLDPTRMTNQPALRTSSGRVWLIMGGLFAVAALIPLALLGLASDGRSRGVATVAGIVIIVLLGAIVLARLLLPSGPTRLRAMAGFMLTMAAVSLVSLVICAVIEASPQ